MQRRVINGDTVDTDASRWRPVNSEPPRSGKADSDAVPTAPNGDNNPLTPVLVHKTPPAAPVKLRRRRHLLLDRLGHRLRNKRKQNDLGTPLRNIVEDYYRVDTVEAPVRRKPNQHPTAADAAATTLTKPLRVLLPGVPKYEDDWSRDVHDFFNLIVLVPVTVLNFMCWNWDVILTTLPRARGVWHALEILALAWSGDWFDVFFTVTCLYFVIDLLWIIVVPSCVKSPVVILQHHFAVLLYILIPLCKPDIRWCMGACMTVEINTWFLIARRVFNKQGFPPWTIGYSWLSIRVKVISVAFYVTWLAIRCVLYPLMMIPVYTLWLQHSRETGSKVNVLLPSVPLHAAFCLLNLKWSYDLLVSKIRYWRRQRQFYRNQQRNGFKETFVDTSISKGL